MYKKDTSITEYRKYMLIRDAIAELFRTYIEEYGLSKKLNGVEIEKFIDRFEKEYKRYVTDTFVELDIQTIEVDGINTIMVNELMTKIAGIVSSKLAIELLMFEIVNKFIHN